MCRKSGRFRGRSRPVRLAPARPRVVGSAATFFDPAAPRKVGPVPAFFVSRAHMAESTHRQDVVSRAEALVDPLVRAEGLELVELEYVREPAGWVLRLFIDRPGRDRLS